MTKQDFINWAKVSHLKVKEAPKYTYILLGKKGKYNNRYRLSNIAVRKQVKLSVGWVNIGNIKYLKDLIINEKSSINDKETIKVSEVY